MPAVSARGLLAYHRLFWCAYRPAGCRRSCPCASCGARAGVVTGRAGRILGWQVERGCLDVGWNTRGIFPLGGVGARAHALQCAARLGYRWGSSGSRSGGERGFRCGGRVIHRNTRVFQAPHASLVGLVPARRFGLRLAPWRAVVGVVTWNCLTGRRQPVAVFEGGPRALGLRTLRGPLSSVLRECVGRKLVPEGACERSSTGEEVEKKPVDAGSRARAHALQCTARLGYRLGLQPVDGVECLVGKSCPLRSLCRPAGGFPPVAGG